MAGTPEPALSMTEATTRTATAVDRGITDYLQYVGVERGLAANTLAAYRRDLGRYGKFLA
ncbi:site-specific integrase, partial [Streptomyces sp. NPDC059696]